MPEVKEMFIDFGDNHRFNNYRPISILPVISKVFEKCVHNQIIKYLELNNLLSSKQFGFRSKRSTELATAYFIDKIRQNMNNGKLTGVIYVDLSKAFDNISHAMILNKLPRFGISGTPQQWISSYLFGRKQQVCLKGILSPPSPITCGVPQGSILGSLLFLLIFNDSVETMSSCQLLMYADDTVIFFSHKDINQIEINLSKDFDSFTRWLQLNELIINTKVGKIEEMLFGTGKRLSKAEKISLDISNNGSNINDTTSYKYLGLGLTNTLCMTEHIKSSLKKASSRVNLLKKMRYFVDSKTAALVYQSMILPILFYCPFVTLATIPNHLKEKIATMENRAERMIGGDFVIPRSENIKQKRICSFVHQCINGKVYDEFKNYFQLKNTRSSTRNGPMVHVPTFKLETYRTSFYVQGAILNHFTLYLQSGSEKL